MITKPSGTPSNRKLANASSQRTPTAVPPPIPERTPANQPVVAPPKLRVVPNPTPPPTPTRPPPIPAHKPETKVPPRPVHQQKTHKVIMAPPRADVGMKKPSHMGRRIILIILMVAFTAGILAWQNGYINVVRDQVQLALNEHQKKVLEDSAKIVAEANAAKEKSEADAATASLNAAEARSSAATWQAEAKKNNDSYVAERGVRLSLEQQLVQAMKEKAKVEADLVAERAAHAKVTTEIATLRDLLDRNKANRRLKLTVKRNTELEAEKKDLEQKLAAALAREGSSSKSVAGLLKASKAAKVEVDSLKGTLLARDREISRLVAEKASLVSERDKARNDLLVVRKQIDEGSKFDWKKVPRQQRYYIWAALQIGLGESTWNYDTIGPPVTVEFWDKTRKKKVSKVYRAYGFYQVLEPNIRPWSKQYCGVELTPQQFRRNADCQDLVAYGEMPRIWDKCNGNEVRKAVCLSKEWFGGPNVRMDASDGQTSVMEYVTNFLTKSPLKRLAKK